MTSLTTEALSSRNPEPHVFLKLKTPEHWLLYSELANMIAWSNVEVMLQYLLGSSFSDPPLGDSDGLHLPTLERFTLGLCMDMSGLMLYERAACCDAECFTLGLCSYSETLKHITPNFRISLGG